MTNPNPQRNNRNIRGEPLDLDTMLDFATIDPTDIESAAEWWDANVPEWRGALDSEPIDDNTNPDA